MYLASAPRRFSATAFGLTTKSSHIKWVSVVGIPFRSASRYTYRDSVHSRSLSKNPISQDAPRGKRIRTSMYTESSQQPGRLLHSTMSLEQPKLTTYFAASTTTPTPTFPFSFNLYNNIQTAIAQVCHNPRFYLLDICTLRYNHMNHA
jgi:hypothetical protein